MATIRQLLNQATARLAPSSPTPRLDAELLLAHLLGWSRVKLLAEPSHQPTADQQAAFDALLSRRAALEPVAYLTGERAFYGLDLLVDRRVLVPRPETELLVECALAAARARLPRSRPLRIADIGTGSGAIAVALAVHLPQAQIIAVDLDREALEVAAGNLARHQVADRVRLLEGDLLEPLTETVDLLVSNPPYTLLNEIDEAVRRHEPHLALDGGPDGLAVYRRLISAAPRVLQPDGALLLEIGAWQAPAVVALIAAHLPAAVISVYPDLAGHDRVIVADLKSG